MDMKEEEIKKITKHYCVKCKEELKSAGGVGFDAFGFLNSIVQRYCPNDKCSRYGVVTVASIPQEVLLN
jgi:hypothetical protein